MERIFQHFKGVIEGLKGACFSRVRSIHDMETRNVVVIWFDDVTPDCWYRVFIDGTYCGVDRYRKNDFQTDAESDEGLYVIDHSEWFSGKTVETAAVFSPDNNAGQIVLSLVFGDDAFHLVCESIDGFCRLRFSPDDK